MINSTYTPKRFEDLNSDSCMVNSQGVTGTITAGTTANVDLKLVDDHILTGVDIFAANSNFGDTLLLQVTDNDSTLEAIYGSAITSVYPNYPILRQFGTNINIPSDTQLKINREGCYPAKVIAGLYLRIVYNSTGTSNVNLAVNYELHKVLF